MRGLLVASLFLIACEREPAIVVRFDAIDASGRRDAATRTVDAATPVDAAVKVGKAECKTDKDCVLVPEAGCDCANGGKLVAVTKTAAAKHKKGGEAVMCTTVMSTDPSCHQHAACIDGACGMKP